MTKYLMIGEVLKPQGLHGECKIRPSAADLSRFETWNSLYMRRENIYEPLPCRVTRIHDGFVYAVLGHCSSPEDAEHFRGELLYVDREHATPLENGAHYIADLIGCKAVDKENGRLLGILKDVLQNGPVDTWVFGGNRPFMAPALLRVFPKVDPDAGIISVDAEALDEVAVFEN